MKKEKGFTLIELMIVIAIIAIIASIAIPSLLGAKKNANETAAQKQMSNVAQVESLWYKQDLDQNGQHDYWVLDYAGFYYAENAAGTANKLIDIGSGNSDPLVLTDWKTVSTTANGGTALSAVVPRNGYECGQITTDPGAAAYATTNGGTTNLGGDVAGTNGVAAKVVNSTEFGFCAFPASYGQTGNAIYIVDQSAVCYQKDMGNGTQIASWAASVGGTGISPTVKGWAIATD